MAAVASFFLICSLSPHRFTGYAAVLEILREWAYDRKWGRQWLKLYNREESPLQSHVKGEKKKNNPNQP